MIAKLRAHRPSHTTVVAYLALFAALGGSSYAAIRLGKNTVTSKNIKNGQVKRPDLGRNAVNSAKVADRSLRALDFAAGQLPQGAQGPIGPAGPVDAFSKAEADARFLPASTVQGFRVAALWRTTSAGAIPTVSTGNTFFNRALPGNVQAVLPLSLPVALNGRRVRPTAAHVCFFQSSPGSTITQDGVELGSGSSPANDSAAETVSISSQFGCLTINIASLLAAAGHSDIGPDTALDLVITATTTGNNRVVQFGPADLTLTPDPA